MPTPTNFPFAVKALLKEGRLEIVARDQELIEHLLSQSNLHIKSAQKLTDSEDLVAAHLVAYDAIRKSCAAAVSSDLQDYFPDLDVLRRQRNAYEYPSFASNEPTKSSVEQVIEMARTVLSFVKISN